MKRPLFGRGEVRARGARDERGGVLVMALVSVVTVTFLGASYLQVSAAATRRQVRAVDTKRAFYLAEAGLAESYAGLAVGKTGNVGSEAEPAAFGDGLFWVEVVDHPDGKKSLESTGMCGSGRAVLSVVVEPGIPGVAGLGVFGGSSVQVRPGSTVDAYDSDKEALLEALAGTLSGGGSQLPLGAALLPGDTLLTDALGIEEVEPVHVSSNGPILVAEDSRGVTTVDGNVRPGPGQSVTVVGTPTITGGMRPLGEAVPLPAIEVPAAIPVDPGIRHADPLPMLLSSGSLGLDYLEVAPNASAVVEGPVTLVVGSLVVEPGAQLTLDPTGGRILVFAQTISLQAGALVTTVGESAEDVTFLVHGTGGSEMAADGAFRGLVYAPGGTLTVDGMEVFGAVSAGDLILQNGARVHFDNALRRAARESAMPHQMTWRIVDLAPPQGATISYDPFEVLGVDPATCPDPARAHQDQQITVEYTDLADVTRTYTGSERSFDWSTVKAVTKLTRDALDVVRNDGVNIITSDGTTTVR